MTRTQRILAGLCVAMLAAGAAAATQEQYSIHYVQMKPGEVLRNYVGTYVTGTITGVGPAMRDMNQKVEQWMRVECLEVDEQGTATCRVTFERMAMTMTMGTRTVSYDSAASTSQPSDPAQAILRRSFGALVGKGITVKISKQGQPLEVTGMTELMEAAWSDVPGGKHMARMFEGVFNEGAIKDNWFGGIEQLPREPVTVGGTWSSEQRTHMGPLGQVRVKSRHKLMEVKSESGRHVAIVATTTNMEMGEGASGLSLPPDAGGGKMDLRMTSQGGKGSWRWDLRRGRMLEMTTTGPFELTADMQSPANPDKPVRITQKAEVTTTTRLLEGNEDAAPASAAATRPAARGPASRPSATAR